MTCSISFICIKLLCVWLYALYFFFFWRLL